MVFACVKVYPSLVQVETSMMTKDLVGTRHGEWQVVDVAGKRGGKRYWLCRCSCGKERGVMERHLLAGRSKSCGHTRYELISKRFWKGVGSLSAQWWRQLLRGAKTRGIEVTITLHDAWEQYQKQEGKCGLTGLLLVPPLGRRRLAREGKIPTASLDRIDSSRPYEVGNIQWVHKEINLMKNVLNNERFVHLCCLVCQKMSVE